MMAKPGQHASLVMVCALSIFTLGCAISPNASDQLSDRRLDDFQPRIHGTIAKLNPESITELRNLQLVATDLVTVLLQLPDFQPTTVTLQVSEPATLFGNTLIRALEDAGYGLQWVSADQGQRYVSYGKRFSETDAGPVTDFEINVNSVSVRREYTIDDKGILPSSLMYVNGTPSVPDIVLNEDMFREQGGSGSSFLSGVSTPAVVGPDSGVDEVTVNEFDQLPVSRRTSPATIFAATRQRYAQSQTQNETPDLSTYSKLRRAVLIFESAESRHLGAGNKQAIDVLARNFTDDDLFVITACTDADGENEDSQAQGVRVEEEFASHGIPLKSVFVAPCIRASFRHSSDSSSVAVTVVHHRRDSKG